MWLATGLPTGTYYALGKVIAELGKQAGLDIQACTTGGSYDNIGLVREGSVTFALAQIDAIDATILHEQIPKISVDFPELSKGCQRRPATDRLTEEPSLVTFLYSEMVHMFIAPHFYISSPADLKQFASKVWLGPLGSGSRVTVERVLRASGIAESNFDKLFSVRINDWNEASERISRPNDDDGLYAFFWARAVTTLQSAAPVSEADKSIDHLLSHDARIAALPQDVINRVTEDGLYSATAIPINAYGQKLKQGVPTVGVATILITSKSSRSDEVESLLELINDNKSHIQSQVGIELDLLSQTVVPDAKLAKHVHDGAREHLIAVDHTSVWVWSTITALVVLFVWLVLFPPRVVRSNSPALSYGLLLLAIFSVLCTVFAFKLRTVEGRINPSFATIPTSFKTMMSFVLGSSHEGKLMTRYGENLVMWALFVIPVVFGWLTSDIIREGLKKLSDLLDGFFRWMGPRLRVRRIAGLFVGSKNSRKKPGPIAPT